jgi:hypothetical protein
MATGSLHPWPFGQSLLRRDRVPLPGGHQAPGMVRLLSVSVF